MMTSRRAVLPLIVCTGTLGGCEQFIAQPIAHPTPPIAESEIDTIRFAPLTAANMVVKCSFLPDADDPGDARGLQHLWIVQTDPDGIGGYAGPDRYGVDRLNWYVRVLTDDGEIFNYSTGNVAAIEQGRLSEFLTIQASGQATWVEKTEYTRRSGTADALGPVIVHRAEESHYVGHCLFGPAH